MGVAVGRDRERCPRWASRTKAAKEALLITPHAVADTSADREDPTAYTISDRLYSRVAEAPPALRWTLDVAAAVAAAAAAVVDGWMRDAPASARSRRVISPTLVATIVSVLGIATVAAVTLMR